MPLSFYSEKFSEIINHIPYPLREKNKSTTILQGDLRWVLTGFILRCNMKARCFASSNMTMKLW
jgi:hypothetical protein